MKKIICLLPLVFFFFILNAQNKTPPLFRWHNHHLKKYTKKHLQIDTFISTSSAVIHIHYKKDSLKPYLLMFHGMGLNARSNWSAQVKSLSKVFSGIPLNFKISSNISYDFSYFCSL